MPITAVDRDPNALTLTITADFPVSRQRLWDAYADPRQLEKPGGRRDGPQPSRATISHRAVSLTTT